MSWLEDWNDFKAGFVNRHVNIHMQKFFKTNPTEEQVVLLEKMSNEANKKYSISLIIAYFLGMFTVELMLILMFLKYFILE